MRWLVIVCLLMACNRVEPETTATTADPSNPLAIQLNQQLIETAKKGDENAFKALLSEQSVHLLEAHFEQMELLERIPGELPYGWRQFMLVHADLPPTVLNKASYPIVMEQGQHKVDINSHPKVNFLRHGIHMPEEPVPTGPNEGLHRIENNTP